MPYIPEWDREFASQCPQDVGQLNYAITALVADYWRRMGHSYSTANDIMGAIEGAKLEFYRRIVAPYEEGKRVENGDVYK